VGNAGLFNAPHERAIYANAGDEPSGVVNEVLIGNGNYAYKAALSAYGSMVESPHQSARICISRNRLRSQNIWPEVLRF
jgi:hypothetical protein